MKWTKLVILEKTCKIVTFTILPYFVDVNLRASNKEILWLWMFDCTNQVSSALLTNGVTSYVGKAPPGGLAYLSDICGFSWPPRSCTFVDLSYLWLSNQRYIICIQIFSENCWLNIFHLLFKHPLEIRFYHGSISDHGLSIFKHADLFYKRNGKSCFDVAMLSSAMSLSWWMALLEEVWKTALKFCLITWPDPDCRRPSYMFLIFCVDC